MFFVQAEARARGQKIRLELHGIVSSPLRMARQTAHAFSSRYGLPVAIRDELTEQHLGRYSGMTYEQIAGEPDYCHDRAARWLWVPEGGGEQHESGEDLFRICGNHNYPSNIAPKAVWFRQHEPAAYHDASILHSAIGYLFHRLTGVASVDVTQCGLARLCDSRKSRWDERLVSVGFAW